MDHSAIILLYHTSRYVRLWEFHLENAILPEHKILYVVLQIARKTKT